MKKVIFFLSALFIFSCSSNDEISSPPVQVYIAGTSYDEANTPRATLIKNGIEQNLEDALNYRSYAKKVIVYNNDVYVLGNIEINFEYKGVIWKNGQIIWEVNNEYSLDFVIENNNLYVLNKLLSGTFSPFGLKYWINNVPFEIESNISFEPPNSYIRVNDNKVYIASTGLYSTPIGQTAGVGVFIYNNGELNFLENSVNHRLSGFDFLNDNFQITSNSYSIGSKYWTSNTFFLNFSDSINFSGVRVFNEDVYVYGKNGDFPFYAKNLETNQPQTPYVYLPSPSFMNSHVIDMYVKNNQVYAIGKNVLWVNDTIQNLPISLEAASIFVD